MVCFPSSEDLNRTFLVANNGILISSVIAAKKNLSKGLLPILAPFRVVFSTTMSLEETHSQSSPPLMDASGSSSSLSWSRRLAARLLPDAQAPRESERLLLLEG